MIVNIPIEPLDQRYSTQWQKWFEDYFKGFFDPRTTQFLSIQPNIKPLRDTIKDGAFLDVVSTTHWKALQVARVAWNVDVGAIPRNERVVFIIQDGWFPVEQLAYMRDMLGCHEWKFVGIFHDGTYDKWDLTARNSMYTWGQDLENSWFKIYDKIIVGSNYHKQVLLETRIIPSHKIAVIPWKVEVPDITPAKDRSKIIVFPHRLDIEKQPRVFDTLNADGYQFCRTKDHNYTKSEYYDVLSKAKICFSSSLLEMFGIAMFEAVLLGCIPLVPDRLAYKEFYPDIYRYTGAKDMHEKFKVMLDNNTKYNLDYMQYEIKKRSDSFFPKLHNVIESL